MSVNIKKPLEQLLSKEVDRKEFLAHLGAAGLGIIGISGLMKALTDPTGKHQANGYGSSPYGGSTEGQKEVSRRV